MRASEVDAFRAAVIACAAAEDREACERLVGQLATLSASAAAAEGDEELAFRPPPGAQDLAERALRHLRESQLRRPARKTAAA